MPEEIEGQSCCNAFATVYSFLKSVCEEQKGKREVIKLHKACYAVDSGARFTCPYNFTEGEVSVYFENLPYKQNTKKDLTLDCSSEISNVNIENYLLNRCIPQ